MSEQHTRLSMQKSSFPLFFGILALGPLSGIAPAETKYALKVFPPEHRRMTDPKTGVELLFLTTATNDDSNLYFHEHSWLADESLILFTSTRTNGGLMGYITATGELITFNSPQGPLGAATAAAKDNCIFAVRGRDILQLRVGVARPGARDQTFSQVVAEERLLCTLKDGYPNTAVNASCDGKFVAFGVVGFSDANRGPAIFKVSAENGELSEVCQLPKDPGYAGHVQWSRTNPNLLSFAGAHSETGDVAGAPRTTSGPEDYPHSGQRLWVVDIRTGIPRNVYVADEGELVTHESWWTHDHMLFCGGKSPTKAVLSHVKELDIQTGEVRIVGAGASIPEASSEAAARANWWHASGSPDGRWVAADNWHGDIMLFEGGTTRPHLLTSDHRNYGHGEHPHVGWDRKGEKVIFASHMLGDLNVCVAKIPKAWNDALTSAAEWRARQSK